MVFSKGLSAAVALAAASVVSAQTSTTCNPLKTSCPADPAFSSETTCDFTAGACDAFSLADGTTLSYGSQGAVFAINTVSNAPTITSNSYIFFGRIDVTVQAAAGQGIVTSCVLQSDDLDEIDIEWVGGDNAQVQSNYFSKGDTSTYTRGAYHPVNNPLGSENTYSVEWTPSALNWIINGATVRTLTYDDATGGTTYPQTPMQIKLGTWVAGGPNDPPGTVEWAGGYTDFNDAPFNAYYKSIVITDYAGGSAPPKNPVKQYVYGDDSGTYQSIKVVQGDGSSSNPSSADSSSAAKSTTAASSTHSKIQSAVVSGISSKTTAESKTTTAPPKSTTTESSAQNSTTFASKTSAVSTGTTTSAPATETTGAAANFAASFGSVAMAGAGLALAQLLF